VTFALDFDGAEVRAAIPAQFRYEGNIFSGEKRMELHVVPQVTLRTSPGIAILPHAPDRRIPTRTAARSDMMPDASRQIAVTVTNNTPGKLDADVRLEAPDGWTVTPASRHVSFARADEADTVGFSVSAPQNVPAGRWPMPAFVWWCRTGVVTGAAPRPKARISWSMPATLPISWAMAPILWDIPTAASRFCSPLPAVPMRLYL